MAFITLLGLDNPSDPTIVEKVRNAVSRTKRAFTEQLQDLVEGRKEIDQNLLDDLEAMMIGADIGVQTTSNILDGIRDQLSRNVLKESTELRNALREELHKILDVELQPPTEVKAGNPFVIFMVGVNGVGKTTTIGKLASRFARDGKKVILCAADTFRAAATEQLQVWADRIGVPMVKQQPRSDPSAVLFDALKSAKAKKVDYVIVDTAGRLHTKQNLMSELEKMTRIAGRETPNAPHEVLLVLDATTGQNGLIQAREFMKTAGLTGLVLTKLDGTAKGGVVIAIVQELGIPIRFVGTGEKIDDLIEFSAIDFVDLLLER